MYYINVHPADGQLVYSEEEWGFTLISGLNRDDAIFLVRRMYHELGKSKLNPAEYQAPSDISPEFLEWVGILVMMGKL